MSSVLCWYTQDVPPCTALQAVSCSMLNSTRIDSKPRKSQTRKYLTLWSPPRLCSPLGMLWVLRENDHCTHYVSCKLAIPLFRASGSETQKTHSNVAVDVGNEAHLADCHCLKTEHRETREAGNDTCLPVVAPMQPVMLSAPRLQSLRKPPVSPVMAAFIAAPPRPSFVA